MWCRDQKSGLHQSQWHCSLQVANLVVLHRALPLMEFSALAPSVAYVVALAALLAWTLWGEDSYLRWRNPVQVAVRLDSLLMRYHRWVSSL